nr:uncharacterized protein LOC113828594 isoform X1 [Penaeus vannamei]
MGPTAVVLWMVAGTVRALGPQRVDSLYDEHYPPIHPNCTQSLTDLLLLRQEAKLSELTLAEQTSTEVLKEAVHLLADIRNSLTFDQGAGGAVSSRGRPTPATARAKNVWVGGYDQIEEGKWIWITKEAMPKGTPYWGAIGFGREPRGGAGENCALLYGTDDFMIHDAPCSWSCKPLCQITHS